ncbi:hypothetical protein ES703_24531 [subsurface metagenome]
MPRVSMMALSCKRLGRDFLKHLVIHQHDQNIRLFQPFIKSGELYAGLIGEFGRKFLDMRLHHKDFPHVLVGQPLHNSDGRHLSIKGS